MRSRPLDGLRSIRVKLGVVIVSAVGVTTFVIFAGFRAGILPRFTVPVAGLLALATIQVLAHGMVSPLREMAAAAGDMARGDYRRRVTATSRDEVGDLARAFNAMAGELAEVDRMRRDLVANVSHELRTPITALQAVLENLVDGVAPPDPATLRTMLGQVERLGRLVAQLLDLSRLESGALHLDRAPFAVAPLLVAVAREASLGASVVPVEVDVEPEGLAVDGDAERVHEVVANLVENAQRHSPPGGVVTLRARSLGGAVRLEVEDEGAGIPPAEAARVFERFYRSDDARTSAAGGAGLGLAIARDIAARHGGTLVVDPDHAPGARFVLRLPLSGRP